MKRISLKLFWILICLHTSVSFSDAMNIEISNALAEIDVIIAETGNDIAVTTSVGTDTELALDAAPIEYAYPANFHITYTPWELIHRTAMLQGFTWSGSIASFITPAMYIGTPLQTNIGNNGYDTRLGATNYSECVRMETDNSFGIDGTLIKATAEDELRTIAKYCAVEYLGSYFKGKEYTTREEMLMLLFTMFDEGVDIPGYFEGKKFKFDGEETYSTYSNVSSKAWFAPYLSLAYNLMMVEDEDTWRVAREVTDNDIKTMLKMYLVDANGKVIDTVETPYGAYTVWYDTINLTIEKEVGTSIIHNSAPENTELSGSILAEEIISYEDMLAELFSE